MTVNVATRARHKTEDHHEGLYRQIRERIFFCEFPPGSILSENALIADLGVPRSQVRNVLRRLEFEGLVTSRQGLGTVISGLDLATVRELYALRIKLEELVGELQSTLSVSDDQLAVFQGLLERLEGLHNHYESEKWLRVMLGYHEAYISLLPDGVLRDLLDQLYYRSARITVRVVPQMSWTREVDALAEEIVQVVDALREGDLFAASRIRRDQLSMWLRRLQNYLGEAAGRPSSPSDRADRSSRCQSHSA